MTKKKAAPRSGSAPKRRRRKVAAAPKQRVKHPKRRGQKLTVQVVVPSTITYASLQDELNPGQRFELAEFGPKRKPAIPTWAHDAATWKKAFRFVSPHWARYEFPWAAVAYTYLRMNPAAAAHGGGRAAPSRSARASMHTRAERGERLAIGSVVNVERNRFGDDPHSGIHTIVGEAGRDYLLVRGQHPHATADEYEVAINRSRVSALASASPRVPKRRAPRSFREGAQELDVEQVELDELGYDESGKYYGVGAPLYRVVSRDLHAEPYVDTVVRAPNSRAAIQQVAQQYRH